MNIIIHYIVISDRYSNMPINKAFIKLMLVKFYSDINYNLSGNSFITPNI